MKLNKEEIYTGIAHSLPWIYFQGWWGILSAILSGFLWAFGGAEGTKKDWRRIGCPVVICLPIVFLYGWQILITGILFHLILRIGYGIPTYLPDGTCTDEGSTLGRIWWWVCGGDEAPAKSTEKMATIGVRTTLAVLTTLAFLPLAWVQFIPYLIGGLLLTALIPIIVDKT